MRAAVWEPLPWRDPTTITALAGDTALDFLHHRWAELYEADEDATPYQAPGWLRGCAALLPSTAAPLVLVASTPAQGPIAALALERDRNHHGKQRLRPLGTPHAEYVRAVGPGASQTAVVAGLMRYLLDAVADGCAVVMPDVPHHSTLGRFLAAQVDWQHSHVLCARIDVPVDFTAMSKSTRRDHTRRERVWSQLTLDGRVGYHLTRTARELTAAADAAHRLNRRRWSGHLLEGDADQAQILQVMPHCGPAEAFVATLTLDERIAATVICLQRGTTCYSLLPAFEPDLADLAPGHALTSRLTTTLTARGYRHLDLGRTLPAEPQRRYKAAWRPTWSTTITSSAGGLW
ncbi:GNAT family N-acetyltransferase [Streptomyces lydicus]|uniref:GNAT family N-acetyltransferase n=1 Tax=Streptomyces lydicus TaxID=47763 RepID=UPI0034067F4D